ncbi:MAG TPA: hypothetical protein VFZ25_04985 [Chloroflexota bacterium]|nr:hypothetical protein [Chloroflexota bacterium]
MALNVKLTSDQARFALAGIRLLNGVAALLVPEMLIRRLGMDPATNPAGMYAFRMFGVRTILIGAALLQPDQALRAYSLRVAVPIHACDTIAAAFGGLRRDLPARAATMAVLISGMNTILAVIARTALDEPKRGGAT